MIDLSGKNILLIGIGFYDYEEAIKLNLEKRGATVSYFSSVYRTCLKKILYYLGFKQCIKWLQNRYLKGCIKSLRDDFDYVIIIKGEGFSENHIFLLKNKYKNVPIVLYLWDSIIRHENASLLLREFDNILTFDRKDAIKYGLKFRPLFFRYEMEPQQKFMYDISCVAELHSDRYDIIKSVKEQLRATNYKYKFILYTGGFTYLIKRYITKEINREDSELFVTKKVSYQEYVDLCSKSKIILDIAHPLQSGLTMRSIEAIGFNRLILTTNKDIVNYPDIASDTYSILDRDNLVLSVPLFQNLGKVQRNQQYFSIDYFVNELLYMIYK